MNFDYIIAGAGGAGCVPANRLSEKPHTNVLLIDACRRGLGLDAAHTQRHFLHDASQQFRQALPDRAVRSDGSR